MPSDPLLLRRDKRSATSRHWRYRVGCTTVFTCMIHNNALRSTRAQTTFYFCRDGFNHNVTHVTHNHWAWLRVPVRQWSPAMSCCDIWRRVCSWRKNTCCLALRDSWKIYLLVAPQSLLIKSQLAQSGKESIQGQLEDAL